MHQQGLPKTGHLLRVHSLSQSERSTACLLAASGLTWFAPTDYVGGGLYIMSVKIKPRFWPRDWIDVLVGLPVGLFQAVFLFLLPSFVSWAVSGSQLVGILTCVILSVIWHLFVVWGIEISPEGIRFRRTSGFPKFLPWGEIESIKPATRREVVLKGWLWPVFPAREMTLSLSAMHHYRIEWKGNFCFFSPVDPEGFEHSIGTYYRMDGAEKRE